MTANAADCHAHVFCNNYPFAPETHYLPDKSQQGTVEKFLAVLDAHGFTHGLLVGAGVYLTDNRCMLASIAKTPGRLKGIGLVKADISERELTALNDAGMIGIRVNPMSFGQREFVAPGFGRLLARVKEMNWFVQVHCEKDNLVETAPLLRKAGVRIMIDHFARPDIARGVAAPGFQALLDLGKSGNAVVKLSGPFRSSVEGYPYRDVDPFIAAAIDAFTLDNCVWGSDWPFVRLDERMDYGPPLTCLERWLPDEKDRRKVLWDTPARLFGFK
jgi:predicted TIM-barrel fold metal-dependent hydrolase